MGGPCTKGLSSRPALPHIGSHQATRAQEGTAKSCSTQPQGGLWKQPAMPCTTQAWGCCPASHLLPTYQCAQSGQAYSMWAPLPG